MEEGSSQTERGTSRIGEEKSDRRENQEGLLNIFSENFEEDKISIFQDKERQELKAQIYEGKK